MSEQTTTASPLVSEVVRRFSEPEWLKSLREKAWTAFSEMPIPRLEKTDLRKRSFDIGPFPSLTEGPSDRARQLMNAMENQAFAYIRDGVVVKVHLPEAASAQGVVFTDLHSAISSDEATVKKHLGSVIPFEESKWAALNMAVWQSGVFLHVPRRTAVETPFVFIYEQSAAGNGAAPRSLVVAEEESSFSYTEVYLTDGVLQSGVVHTDVLEVVVGDAAAVTVAVSNEFQKGPTNFTTRRAKAGKDAKMDWVYSDAGDGFTVGLVETDLVGSGSAGTLKGIAIGRGRQHSELTASMLHRGRYSESDIQLHGALRDRSNAIYRSSTHIFKNAVAASGEQNDRMLMLDPTARAEAIPMLLIDENDVERCGHAASVGRIDESQIYYLQSRGIPANVARRMIVWGHLEPTVDAFPEAVVREYVRTRITEELG